MGKSNKPRFVTHPLWYAINAWAQFIGGPYLPRYSLSVSSGQLARHSLLRQLFLSDRRFSTPDEDYFLE